MPEVRWAHSSHTWQSMEQQATLLQFEHCSNLWRALRHSALSHSLGDEERLIAGVSHASDAASV